MPRDLELPDQPQQKEVVDSLPHDSINLFDTHQLQYYGDDEIVKKCSDVIKNRRLDVAINRPKNMWLSLSDYVHKNRLVLPFYDLDNNIIFYQSRTIIPSEKLPKYLSKIALYLLFPSD